MNMVNSSEQSRLDGPNDSMTMIAAPTTSSTATNSSSTNNNPNTLVYNHNNKSIEQKKKELTLNLGGSGGMQLGLNGFTPARTLNTPQMLNNMSNYFLFIV